MQGCGGTGAGVPLTAPLSFRGGGGGDGEPGDGRSAREAEAPAAAPRTVSVAAARVAACHPHQVAGIRVGLGRRPPCPDGCLLLQREVQRHSAERDRIAQVLPGAGGEAGTWCPGWGWGAAAYSAPQSRYSTPIPVSCAASSAQQAWFCLGNLVSEVRRRGAVQPPPRTHHVDAEPRWPGFGKGLSRF